MKRLLRWLCALVLCLWCIGAWAEEFAVLNAGMDLFLAEGSEQTEDSYRSRNVAVVIETQRYEKSDVYTAHVYLRSAESFRRAFGGGEWGRNSEKLTALAQKNGAVLALTGDSGHHFKAGFEVGNGVLERARGNNVRDLCVLYKDGRMETYYAKVDHERIARETDEGLIWQTFVFGPALLDENGKAFEDFSSSDVRAANPRAVIGYFEPGHYCLVQIDGRGTESALEAKKSNRGLTLEQTARLMESLGCTAAYNLDGGQSAAMWFGGEVISTPYRGGRTVGDAIVICDMQEVTEASEAYEVSLFEVAD